MGIISLFIALLLALVARALRQHWEKLCADAALERVLWYSRNDRLENRILTWRLIYLSALWSMLGSLFLAFKEFGLLNWLLK